MIVELFSNAQRRTRVPGPYVYEAVLLTVDGSTNRDVGQAQTTVTRDGVG